MLQEKILVAPALEPCVHVGPERGQRIAAAGVKMARVLLEAVIGREVHAAAKPPHVDGVGGPRHEKTHVHVHGRHIGIARMQHQGHAHRLEAATGQLRAVGAGRGGQLAARDLRKADPGPFEQVPIFQNAGDAAALQGRIGGFVPAVFGEAGAVQAFQFGHDALLQFEQVAAYPPAVDRFAHGRPGGPQVPGRRSGR